MSLNVVSTPRGGSTRRTARGFKVGRPPKNRPAPTREAGAHPPQYDSTPQSFAASSYARAPKAPRPIEELEARVRDRVDSWETDSLFEDASDDLAVDMFPKSIDACTNEEGVYYRQLLRELGPVGFIERTIDTRTISVKKLLTAFGVTPPSFLEGSPDDDYFAMLTLAMTRELAKRAKISRFNTVNDAVDLIMNAKNIIVLTGAGISTSLGIPDFRSNATGLYSQLEKMDLNISDPQEVFNIDVFEEDPEIFFSVARNILPDDSKVFTPTHQFIALLQRMGKLLTNYTQNIDNIEANAGIMPEKLVQCHGSFATATCRKCGYQVPGDSIFAEIKAGDIPRCTKCIAKARSKGSVKRKRTQNGSLPRKLRRSRSHEDSDSEDYAIAEAGVMKPDITFFGEPLPDEFGRRLVEHDSELVDLVIVIGTSLKVAPVSELVPYLPPNIPQLYISKTPVNHINFDIDLLGDCDVIVAELCRRAGWDLLHPMIPPNQQVDIQLERGYSSRHIFTELGTKMERPEVKLLSQPDKPSKPATSAATSRRRAMK